MRGRARRTCSGCGSRSEVCRGVHINDFSDYYTQLAIQGPKAEATLQKLTSIDLSVVKNYWFTWGQVCGCHNVMIARTGYTGEDGFEIYIPSDEPTSAGCGARCWRRERSSGFVPCGLGARNTLRLEAAMALYGHEISDAINVLEADWGVIARWIKARSLWGGGAVQGAGGGRAEEETGRAGDGGAWDRAGWLSGLSLEGEKIGEITSGSPGPFIKKNIALAYVPVDYAAVDGEVAVEIRGGW